MSVTHGYTMTGQAQGNRSAYVMRHPDHWSSDGALDSADMFNPPDRLWAPFRGEQQTLHQNPESGFGQALHD